MVLLVALFASAAFAAPIGISSIEELQKIGRDLAYPQDGSYFLTQDIDASATETWNDSGTTTDTLEGFSPIGLTGVFDGQGHTITGLVINRPSGAGWAALFADLGTNGIVQNLGLIDGSVIGSAHVGSLVGENDGTVTQCYATGAVSGAFEGNGGGDGKFSVGGLVGCNYGVVSRSYATGAVSGGFAVGGLIGVNGSYGYPGGPGGYYSGTVTDCYASGAVSALTREVGGLIGQNNHSSVTRCYATGRVAAVLGLPEPSLEVGGLIGSCSIGQVTECCATGTVSGGAIVGGLIGIANGDCAVIQCYARGAVLEAEPELDWRAGAGGLIGMRCYWYSQVGTVAQCFSTGAVYSTGSRTGGLIGLNSGADTVTNSYWDVQASGRASSGGGTGKNTTEMHQQATFSRWDFTNVWRIKEYLTYPYFAYLPQPPDPPGNVSPDDRATAVSVTPTLTATAFSDPNTSDTHAASQWQVRTAASPSSYTVTVFDSGVTTRALTSCTVPAGALDDLTLYRWHVRYADNHGLWSDWSAETGFTTLDVQLSAPTGVTAYDGAFEDRVRVSWTAPVGAATYKIYRSTRPSTATATLLTANWVAVNSYDDPVALPEIERHILYYYWVRAAKDATGRAASDFSACDSGWAGAGWVFPSSYRGSVWFVH